MTANKDRMRPECELSNYFLEDDEKNTTAEEKRAIQKGVTDGFVARLCQKLSRDESAYQ
jgi:hypothetical protein